LLRLTVLLVGVLAGPHAVAAQSPAASPLSSAAYREDFDSAWTFVRDNYAYFHQKATDWERARTGLIGRVSTVQNRRQFVGLLEEMLAELYDHHAHLGVNTPASPRLIPSGTDVWAEHRAGRPVITAVREGSEGERVGLLPGMEIVAIEGKPARQAVAARMPLTLKTHDSEAEDWSLRTLLAGSHDRSVRITVRTGGQTSELEFRPGITRASSSPLAVRILAGNIAYIRIHNSLGDTSLVSAWDSAMSVIRDTRALILDLRDTPSGGNTTVARGLLSRLVPEVRAYQRHDLPAEESRYGVQRIWVEYVAPRGPFSYGKPTAALVSRWTGSMGEGLAIGLDGAAGSTIIGTPMARLRGATYGITLRHTGIHLRVPAERLYHIDGTPREAFAPRIKVEPADSKSDQALAAALRLFGNE
jgi:carboxyl-terminal processing protease